MCILNTCKVIFGLLKILHLDAGADKFMPILIMVVLRANPPQICSNLYYIQLFRSDTKLTGETEYYVSSLVLYLQPISAFT